MNRLSIVLALAVLAAVAAPNFAETKKMAPSKAEASSSLKVLSCPTPCDFTVKTHDENELISIVKAHAKKMHKMDLTNKQIKEMMKTETAAK